MKDVSMQHMTITEYVAVAILTELATKDTVLKLITDGQLTGKDVVRGAFNWADAFMLIREERNAKTKTT